MPKAIVDAAKGLYQTAGAGLILNSGSPLIVSYESVSIAAAATGNADADKLVHLISVTSAGSAATLQLPTSGVAAGTIKIIMVVADAGAGLTVDGGATSQTSLGANDLVVAIFDGTDWQLGAGAV